MEVSKKFIQKEFPREPFAHLKQLDDLFKCQKLQKIYIPSENVRDYFPLVLGDVLVKKYIAVWQRKTYFIEDYRSVPLNFCNNFNQCLLIHVIEYAHYSNI